MDRMRKMVDTAACEWRRMGVFLGLKPVTTIGLAAGAALWFDMISKGAL